MKLLQGRNTSECGIQVLNILEESVVNKTKANCLTMYFGSIESSVNATSQLHIVNYQSGKACIEYFYLPDISYDIKIRLSKTTFKDLKIGLFSLYCSDFEGQVIIIVYNCNFTGISDTNQNSTF